MADLTNVNTTADAFGRNSVVYDTFFANFVGRNPLFDLAIKDNSLIGKSGTELTVAAWNDLAPMDILTEDQNTPREKLTRSTVTMKIQEASKIVPETNLLLNTDGETNWQLVAAQELGKSAAKRVELELGKAIKASAAQHLTTSGAVFSQNDVAAATALVSDAWDSDEYVVVVNPSVAAQIMQTEDFQKWVGAGADNSIFTKGTIGSLLGVQVIRSANVDTAVLLRRSSLRVVYAQTPTLMTQFDFDTRQHIMIGVESFAVGIGAQNFNVIFDAKAGK